MSEQPDERPDPFLESDGGLLLVHDDNDYIRPATNLERQMRAELAEAQATIERLEDELEQQAKYTAYVAALIRDVNERLSGGDK